MNIFQSKGIGRNKNLDREHVMTTVFVEYPNSDHRIVEREVTVIIEPYDKKEIPEPEYLMGWIYFRLPRPYYDAIANPPEVNRTEPGFAHNTIIEFIERAARAKFLRNFQTTVTSRDINPVRENNEKVTVSASSSLRRR